MFAFEIGSSLSILVALDTTITKRSISSSDGGCPAVMETQMFFFVHVVTLGIEIKSEISTKCSSGVQLYVQ